jgi:hypothetical protein
MANKSTASTDISTFQQPLQQQQGKKKKGQTNQIKNKQFRHKSSTAGTQS